MVTPNLPKKRGKRKIKSTSRKDIFIRYIRDFSITFLVALIGVLLAFKLHDIQNERYEKKQYISMLESVWREMEYNLFVLSYKSSKCHYQGIASNDSSYKEFLSSLPTELTRFHTIGHSSIDCLKSLYTSSLTYKYAIDSFRKRLPDIYHKNAIIIQLPCEELVCNYIGTIGYLFRTKRQIFLEYLRILGRLKEFQQKEKEINLERFDWEESNREMEYMER